jgi:hypothetical protein
MSGALLIQNPDGAHPIARAVLEIVRSRLGDGIETSWNAEFKRYDAEPRFARFDNCREQGYIVFMNDLRREKQINIAFAEHRNSDDIVIYVFEKKTFNAPHLTDFDNSVWENSQHFRHNAPYTAAEFIATKLVEFWDENKDNVRRPLSEIRAGGTPVVETFGKTFYLANIQEI